MLMFDIDDLILYIRMKSNEFSYRILSSLKIYYDKQQSNEHFVYQHENTQQKQQLL